jgi:hypothetical protein
VTSFGTALKDIDLLESKAWSCVFVDEAHRVKNANSQTRIAFSRFDCLVRFGLTVLICRGGCVRERLYIFIYRALPSRITIQNFGIFWTGPILAVLGHYLNGIRG